MRRKAKQKFDLEPFALDYTSHAIEKSRIVHADSLKSRQPCGTV
jgi:hypothetical protein